MSGPVPGVLRPSAARYGSRPSGGGAECLSVGVAQEPSAAGVFSVSAASTISSTSSAHRPSVAVPQTSQIDVYPAWSGRSGRARHDVKQFARTIAVDKSVLRSVLPSWRTGRQGSRRGGFRRRTWFLPPAQQHAWSVPPGRSPAGSRPRRTVPSGKDRREMAQLIRVLGRPSEPDQPGGVDDAWLSASASIVRACGRHRAGPPTSPVARRTSR